MGFPELIHIYHLELNCINQTQCVKRFYHSVSTADFSHQGSSQFNQLSLKLWIHTCGTNAVWKCHHHHYLSLNSEGRWSTTDNFATSFLHLPFPVLHCPPGLSIPWCCLSTSSSVLSSSPFHYTLQDGWPDLMNRRHDHTNAVCVSLQWTRGLRAVRLPAGSWHRLPYR